MALSWHVRVPAQFYLVRIMNKEDQGSHDAVNTPGDQPEDEVTPQREEAAPTDFRKHFWLLVAILVTVVIAAIVGRVWMAAPSGPDVSPAPPDRQPTDVPRQP
jgi:hypothetical protein